MIIQKEVRNLIKEISNEFDLPFELVRYVIYSQFKFTRQELEKGVKGDFSTFKNIVVHYFGTFHATEGKINYFNKKNEEHSREL
jgi:hypothetical protein